MSVKIYRQLGSWETIPVVLSVIGNGPLYAASHPSCDYPVVPTSEDPPDELPKISNSVRLPGERRTENRADNDPSLKMLSGLMGTSL